MSSKRTANVYLLAVSLLLSACVGVPEGIEPVGDFELERYLGRWYEIARLDHSFERGLDGVTADYSMREDGGVRVVNSGYSPEKGRRETAEGRAYFVEARDKAYLKVSFFGPFYGAYIVFGLDPEYRYSMVTGPDRRYLWFLSRSPTPDQAAIDEFLHKATELGFATEELIWPAHEL